MWKGLLRMKPDDITALPHIPRLRIVERNGALELVQEEEEAPGAETTEAVSGSMTP